jgi:hypothetical protein
MLGLAVFVPAHILYTPGLFYGIENGRSIQPKGKKVLVLAEYIDEFRVFRCF